MKIFFLFSAYFSEKILFLRENLIFPLFSVYLLIRFCAVVERGVFWNAQDPLYDIASLFFSFSIVLLRNSQNL